MAFFSDSGRQVDNYGDFVVGRAAIGEHMRQLLGDTTRALRWSPDFAQVSHDGSLGYTWGRWIMLRRGAGAGEELGRGRYLTVWRKQADGKWLAEADVGTGNGEAVKGPHIERRCAWNSWAGGISFKEEGQLPALFKGRRLRTSFRADLV